MDQTAGKLGAAPGRVWRARASGWIGAIALIAIGLAVYGPGLWTIPPIDRDESRFAQASRQMFESLAWKNDELDPAKHSGGLAVPMVQDRARLNKPPLIYWLQTASAWVCTGGHPERDAIWMYRLPSVACALITVLLTWRLGLTMFDPRAAWLGAALLAVCPLVVFDAHQARADQLLLTTVVATQFALWRVWTTPSIWAAVVFWAALAAGVLAKGPIAPMIAALTALMVCVASRSWKLLADLRPVFGVVIIAACVGPWVFAVGQHVGWPKYLSIIADETLGRSIEPKEGHWGPPGYHTVLLAVLFWPGSMLAASGVARAVRKELAQRHHGETQRHDREGVTPTSPRSSSDVASAGERTGSPSAPAADSTAPLRSRLWGWWKNRAGGRSAELFCLAWIVPAWVVFEFIGTKLPHYTMPLYPAIALLSARAVLSVSDAGGWRRLGLHSRAATLGLGAWLLIGLAISGAGLAFAIASQHAGFSPGMRELIWLATASAPACAALACAGIALDRRRAAAAQLWSILAAALSAAILVGWVLPRIGAPWTSPRLADSLRSVDPGETRPIALIGYHEDSLVFLTRGRAERLNADQLTAWANEHPTGLVVLPESALDDAGSLTPVESVGVIRGFNYSNGRRVSLVIAEVTP